MAIGQALPEKTQLTLEEAIQYALAHNRELSRAELGLRSTALAVDSARSTFDLKIVPSSEITYDDSSEKTWLLGARASKKLSSGMMVSVRPAAGELAGEPYSTVALALQVPLLRGFGEEYAMSGVHGSLYALQSAQLAYYSQQVSVVLQVVQAVYGAIQKGLQIEMLAQQTARLQEHLALVRAKEKAGIAGAIDVYRAEIRLKKIQDEAALLRQEYADTLGEVKKLLAIPQSGEIVIHAPLQYQPMMVQTEEAIAIAEKNRIELEQSKRLLQENERLLLLSRKNLLPQLDLQLSYNRSGSNTAFDLPDETYLATLSSDTDVFRTAEKNAYAQQQLSFQQIQLDRENQKENIRQQVRSEISNLEKHQQRLALREEQLRQTRGKMQLAESKFKNGMADNFILLEAQTEMQEAQNNHLLETIAYIVRTYRFRSALGTLLAREGQSS